MRFIPLRGFMGDPVPFWWDGAYHLFYLRRLTEESATDGCPWSHAVSRDLVHWEELPDAIPPGPEGAPDCGGVWTGSVIEREGIFHAYYTGHAPEHAERPQTVCHATSRDLIVWEKDPANPILRPPAAYEITDWRDPFVFRHPEQGCYWMAVTSRLREPACAPRRGCLTVANSPDLERWEVQEPIWTPFSVHAPECPDLWQQGEAWRLLFSNGTTQLRQSPALTGPWTTPPVTHTDGRWLYAAKCFHTPERHLLVGWIPSRKGNRDDGAMQWGGTLSLPREAVTGSTGELAWRIAPEIAAAWSRPAAEPNWTAASGTWEQSETHLSGASRDGLALLLADAAPPSYRLNTTITLEDQPHLRNTSCGVLLRLGADGGSGYCIALEPDEQRIVCRKWQRWGDPEPYAVQALRLDRRAPISLDLYLDGSCLEVGVQGQAVLSARCYDHTEGSLALWVQDGAAQFRKPHLFRAP